MGIWADAKAQVESQELRRAELRAAARAPRSAEWVSKRVYSTGSMLAYTGHGWELVTALSQGRGAGFQSYIVRKKRSEILDEASGM